MSCVGVPGDVQLRNGVTVSDGPRFPPGVHDRPRSLTTICHHRQGSSAPLPTQGADHQGRRRDHGAGKACVDNQLRDIAVRFAPNQKSWTSGSLLLLAMPAIMPCAAGRSLQGGARYDSRSSQTTAVRRGGRRIDVRIRQRVVSDLKCAGLNVDGDDLAFASH